MELPTARMNKTSVQEKLGTSSAPNRKTGKDMWVPAWITERSNQLLVRSSTGMASSPCCST